MSAGKNPSGFEKVNKMELLAYLGLVIATCWLFTLSILFVTTGQVIRPANKLLQKHLPHWIMNNYYLSFSKCLIIWLNM